MRKDLLPDFLHLFHAFGNHRGALLRLLDHCGGDPSRARRSDPGELRELGFGARAVACVAKTFERLVETDLDWASQAAHRLICYDDEAYPERLRQIADFPLLLYARGDTRLLRSPQIAVVGSRRCTPGGARTAFEFAAGLAAAGLTVTSGLALGIDAEAHRGALQAAGNTLAVIATGADLDYPASNRRLAERIRATGLIVSEFPLGSPARRAHFPRRNRIISGLSLATLVVEAARRFGERVGIALVSRPLIERGGEFDFRMAEFFVLRRYRRLGVGRDACQLIFNRFSGRWEVGEFLRNEPAVAFWRRVISQYTRGQFREWIANGEIRQRFRSSSVSRA